MIGHFKICNFFYLAALVGHLWLWQKLLGLFCYDKLNHFTSYGSPKLVMHFYVIILIRKYWYWNFSIFLILILLQYFSDWILVLILQYFKSILNTSTFILYWSMLCKSELQYHIVSRRLVSTDLARIVTRKQYSLNVSRNSMNRADFWPIFSKA